MKTRRIAPMSVDQILTASARQLAKARDGELMWSWRVRFADAVDRAWPKDLLWRQQAFAYLAARETLPAFVAIEPQLPNKFRGLPQRFLKSAQRMLLGEAISRDDAIGDIHFEDQIEAAQDAELSVIGSGIYAVLATYSALPFEVARKASMYRDFEHDRLWTADYRLSEMDDAYGTWDNHYWCSLVAAGFGGTDKVSVSRRRAFWFAWLTRLAPKTLQPPSRLIALVRRRVR